MVNLQLFLRQTSLFMTDGTKEYQLLDFSENYYGHTSEYYSQGFSRILQSYDSISAYALAGIPKLNMYAIVCGLFQYLLKTPIKNVNLLEIGNSFDSTAYFAAKTLELFSTDNCLYCYNIGYGKDFDTCTLSNHIEELTYYKNIQHCLGNFKNIVLLKGNFQNEISMLKDDYFDIVLVNGCHGYEAFTKDIINAIRVIKSDGILISYHCDQLYIEIMQDIKEKEIKKDQPDETDNSAVLFVLRKLFDANNETVPYSAVWSKEITADDKLEIRKQLADPEKCKIWNRLISLVDHLIKNLETPMKKAPFPVDKKVLLYNGAMLMAMENLLAAGNNEADLRKIKLFSVRTNECNLALMSAVEEKNEPLAQNLFQKELILARELKKDVLEHFKQPEYSQLP